MAQLEYHPPFKSETQLRAEYGEAAATYEMKRRRISGKISAYLERLHADYLAALRQRRYAKAGRVRQHADMWIARQARLSFHAETALKKAKGWPCEGCGQPGTLHESLDKGDWDGLKAFCGDCWLEYYNQCIADQSYTA